MSSYVRYVKDTFKNFVTGLGMAGVDPNKAIDYDLTLLDRNVLENMYRGDWLARKIVEAPPEDMTREWRVWLGSQPQIDAMEEIEKVFDIKRKVKQWMNKARLYGGAALVIGVDDGNDPSQPLDLNKCGKDCLKYVVVLHRYELNAGPRIYNVLDPYYSRAAYYTVATPMYGFGASSFGTAPSNLPITYPGAVQPTMPAQLPGGRKSNFLSNIIPFRGRKNQQYSQSLEYSLSTIPTNVGLTQIHPSRILELAGNELPDWRLAPLGGGWGDSVLQTVVDMVNSFTSTVQSSAAIVADGKLDVVKIPQMALNLRDNDYRNKLIERFTLSAQTKSVISALLLDKEEEWQRVTTNYGGLPMIMHEFITLVSGAANIPVSILFGQAYGRGMQGGSTSGGADDRQGYYDTCANDQKTEIAPRIEMLDEVMKRSALGAPQKNVTYDWRPLWQLSDEEKANIALKKAQTTQIYVSLGLINEDAMREGVVSQLNEDGTYPGFEDAVEEFGAEPEEPEDTGGYMPGGGYGPQGPNGGGNGGNGRGGNGGGNGGNARALDYDPDQPRDPDGRWSGGAGGNGSEPELPLTGGGMHEEAQNFLGSDKAKAIIKSAVKGVSSEMMHAVEHISGHEAESILAGVVGAALVSLGAPVLASAAAGSIAGYAMHRLAEKLNITPEKAHAVLKTTAFELRRLRERAERMGESFAHARAYTPLMPAPAFGIGDVEKDRVLLALRLLEHALKSNSPEQLSALAKIKDEGAGHPFRGNQYTTGESGGGADDDKGEHPGHGYSKDAYVDKQGVIQTDDVRDATRALWEGRKVELHQVSEVSTLIQHLGKVAAEMEKLGNKAPDFNLCNVSVANTNLFCAETKGIRRQEMPQFENNEQALAFVDHLKAAGYKVTAGTEYAANLRATQNELIGKKVAGVMKTLRSGVDPTHLAERPLVISKDNYIVDGHHTWAGKLGLDAADGNLRNDKKMNIERVDIEILPLLKEADKFTHGAGHKGLKDRRRVRDFDPDQPRDDHGRWTSGGGGGAEAEPLMRTAGSGRSRGKGKKLSGGDVTLPEGPASPQFEQHIKDVVSKTADPRILPSIFYNTTESFVSSSMGPIKPMAQTNRQTGKIEVFVRNCQDQSDKQIGGIIAHESMHKKFNEVLNDRGDEEDRLEREVGNDRMQEFRRDGMLPSDLAERFPTEDKMLHFDMPSSKDALINEVINHPVSGYATMYWARLASGETSPKEGGLLTAIHETLAEVARRHHEEGQPPADDPTWVSMYNTVNDLWEKKHAPAAAHNS